MRVVFGVFFIFISFCLNAQTADTICQNVMSLKKFDTQFSKVFQMEYPQFHLSKTYLIQAPLTNHYKVDHLPSLFCKIENKIQGKSRIAPRFRLGSVDYTEYMEGKRRYYE